MKISMDVNQEFFELDLKNLTINSLNEKLKDKNILRFAIIENGEKIKLDCAVGVGDYKIKNIFDFKPRNGLLIKILMLFLLFQLESGKDWW
jgi:tRNA A22 N-methylase